MNLESVEGRIAEDKWSVFTIIALLSALGIFLNSTVFLSAVLGVAFSLVYFLITSVFWGEIFFQDEGVAFRISLGFLTSLLFIALGGALYIVANVFPVLRPYMNFNTIAATAILGVITVVASLINHRLVKQKKVSL